MSNKPTQVTTEVPMQFAFSESEYRSRCQDAKIIYENRVEKPAEGIIGAIVEFIGNGTLDEIFEVYHQYRSIGWTAQSPKSGLPTATTFESPLAQFTTLYLTKPEHDQERDLAKICKQVRKDYEAELEAALNAEIDRQVAMSLAKDERDRLQAEQQQRLNREQEVRDELAASRAKLREKLIKTGKLNADGSAA
ncbi:hypothetical protein [Pseudomonas sp. NPDC087804]|uniref:hypothetical protein n=1 Tax=Pseudomonas sp. NPDC087804 TaxID=3364449 RepID=UPI00381216DD